MSVTNGSFANVSMLCPYVWEVGDRNISAFCCSSKENQSDKFYLDFGYDTTYAAVICTVVAILVWVSSVTFYLTCKHGICFCRDYEGGDVSSDEDHNLDDPVWWEKRRIAFDICRFLATLLTAMHFFPIPSVDLNISAQAVVIPLLVLDVIFFFSFMLWLRREEFITPLRYYTTFYVVTTGFPTGSITKFVLASYYDDPGKIPLFALFLPHGILFYILPLIALVFFMKNICSSSSCFWSFWGMVILLAAWVLSMVEITYYVWPQSLPYFPNLEYLAPCTLSQALAPLWLLIFCTLVVTHSYFFSSIRKGGNAKSAALHLTPDLLHLYGMCCTAVILTFYYDQHLETVPGIDQYMKPFWPLLLADLLGITSVLLRLCSHCCSAPYRSALPSVPIRLGQLRSTDMSPPYDHMESLTSSVTSVPSVSTYPSYPTLPPIGQTPGVDARPGRISTAEISVPTKVPVCDYQLTCQRFKNTLGIDESYFSHDQDKCFCEACHMARGDDDYFTQGIPKKRYAMPVGWTRFGLSLNPTFKDRELNVFKNWHRAYHGTDPDVVKKILQNSSQLLMPGDVALGGRKLGEREGHFNPNRKPKGFDTKQVFVTPSIVYAGLDVYASPKKFEDGDKVYKARAAFQLCIRPDSYEVGPETVGARGKGETIDPLFGNDELEWSTKERGGTALYGLLVKLEEWSNDVDVDERSYAEPSLAELRFSRTFEMLYLLDALAGLKFPDDDDYDYY